MPVPFLLKPYFLAKKPGIAARTPSISYHPAQIFKAYTFPKVGAVPTVKIGIGSLGGMVNPSWVRTAFAAWSLPEPKITVMGVLGASIFGFPNDPNSNIENMSDLLWSAALYSLSTGQQADVTICYASASQELAISAVTDALVKQGCLSINWSWGGPLPLWSLAAVIVTKRSFAVATSKGVTIHCASGDNSADDGTVAPTCDAPGCFTDAWCCGGTTLLLAPDGTIAQESAWGDGSPTGEGGGGGFDLTVPTPSWQLVALNGKGRGRGCPDSSANADPQTAYDVYVNDQWMAIGGTSLSAPVHTALTAIIKGMLLSKGLPLYGNPGPILYPHPECFHDILTGSDGYATTPGWDPATGNGSLDGTKILDVVVAAQTALKASTPPTDPTGGTTTAAPTAPTQPTAVNPLLDKIDTELESLFDQYHSINASVFHDFIANVESNVIRVIETAFNPPSPAEAKALGDGKLLLSAGKKLRFMVAILGPFAKDAGDAYIAALPIPGAGKAALLALLNSLLAPPATAPVAPTTPPATAPKSNGAESLPSGVEVLYFYDLSQSI